MPVWISKGNKYHSLNKGVVLARVQADCNVSNYSVLQWLSPAPVKQLGAVTDKGVPK